MREWFVITEHRSENISSLLRWFFLVLCIPIFYYPPISNVLNYETDTFPLLLAIGILYMTSTQIVLHKCHEKSVYYRFFTRGGIVFDYIAYAWLMQLSGGAESPFVSVGYLIVIHAALYWRLKGAFLLGAAIFSTLMFFFITDSGYQDTMASFEFFMKSCFLWLIALYGGIIASKERQHYLEKNMYQLQSEQDYLTGLLNHRKFQEDVLEKTKQNKPFTLVLCDIDRFKNFNDQHGHLIGDEVLKLVGATFKRYISIKDGEAYRYGGEEFAWILHTASQHEVKKMIESINSHLKRFPYTIGNEPLPVTLSYGIAIYKTGEKPAEMIQRADMLLYEAKSSGRNTLKLDTIKMEENQLMM
ncbi:GGDEF domain-containing protein [Fictibacillus sp. b24]|uniref:GGDEF domain-containing protein n=1 Tax=Fictibacillus sp. b24 TaxID=3055863 RepID=UPI0025A17D05|nr:GGDEF domain-containing protein [Fictibacillus sp. b24]MDM5316859.1 GGDEF domain-containing protein [Fictibacillus sp. b24]